MKKFLFLLFFFFIFSVPAYTIICEDEIRGVQIWNSEQTFNETGWTLEDMESEEGLNCTLIEIPITLGEDYREYEPVINQLNQKLKDNHEEITTLEKRLIKYNLYKFATFLFMVLFIVLVVFLKINSKEEHGNKTR